MLVEVEIGSVKLTPFQNAMALPTDRNPQNRPLRFRCSGHDSKPSFKVP
jgi:hypothetical protein